MISYTTVVRGMRLAKTYTQRREENEKLRSHNLQHCWWLFQTYPFDEFPVPNRLPNNWHQITSLPTELTMLLLNTTDHNATQQLYIPSSSALEYQT